MKILRLGANIRRAISRRRNYDILGLEPGMDLHWIRTYRADAQATPQVRIALEGGSGTPGPALSVAIDDFDGALRRVRRTRFPIEYGTVQEPWGVRRFYMRAHSAS